MKNYDEILLEKLAQKIKYQRNELNLSQEKLAEKCGFDRTYISLLERAKRNPSYLSLKKLCIGLEIELIDLLKREIMTDKERIIDIFEKNVKGKKSDTSLSNQNHDGKEGHWLETQMGIAHNGNNEADLLSYEMKNQTTSGKITFGDWSADEYIYLHGREKNKTNSINSNYSLTRDDFLRIFGNPNPLKDNRLSWSGIPCPTYYGDISKFGQYLTMDSNSNILIIYSFSKDQREDKKGILPIDMQIDNLVIAKWKYETLKVKVERKFNQNGWFTCLKNSEGIYNQISFGKPMNFESWIFLFKERVIFFDSGMYQGNIRPYSQWRATTSFWHTLITETH